MSAYGSDSMRIDESDKAFCETFAFINSAAISLGMDDVFAEKQEFITPKIDAVCGDFYLKLGAVIIPGSFCEHKSSSKHPNASFKIDRYQLDNSKAEFLVMNGTSGIWITTMACARKVARIRSSSDGRFLLVQQSDCRNEKVLWDAEGWLHMICDEIM